MILLSTEVVQQNLKPVEPGILLNGAKQMNVKKSLMCDRSDKAFKRLSVSHPYVRSQAFLSVITGQTII